jgi:hypothetical protein
MYKTTIGPNKFEYSGFLQVVGDNDFAVYAQHIEVREAQTMMSSRKPALHQSGVLRICPDFERSARKRKNAPCG